MTSFDVILNKFYKRLEKDEDFFNYYNIDIEEAKSLAEARAKSYLIESLDDLSTLCTPIPYIDISDYDEDFEILNYDVKKCDVNLIVDSMFVKYMEKDIPLLHAFQVNFTPTDLNVFSPANERNSYNNMIKGLNEKLIESIDKYNSTNRETNKKIGIDYTSYDWSGENYEY